MGSNNASSTLQEDALVSAYIMENFPLPVYLNIFITIISLGVIGLAIVAILAMSKTKTTPGNVRMTSTCLLLLNSLGAFSYTIRRHSESNITRMVSQLIGVWSSSMAFLIVGAMSAERLIVFQWPYFYIRFVTRATYRKMLTVYLTLCTAHLLFVRLGLCYLLTEDSNYGFQTLYEKCSSKLATYIRGGTLLVTIVTASFYLRIFIIVKRISNRVYAHVQSTGSMSLSSIKQYRSTLFVFLFFSTVLFTGSGYVTILALDVDLSMKHFLNDVLNVCNNICDVCVYVFWFKECRMNVLLFLSRCKPSLKDKVETMRHDIFRIVPFSIEAADNNRIRM